MQRTRDKGMGGGGRDFELKSSIDCDVLYVRLYYALRCYLLQRFGLLHQHMELREALDWSSKESGCKKAMPEGPLQQLQQQPQTPSCCICVCNTALLLNP